MKRIVNYRPLCIFALFQVCGIIISTKVDSSYWLRTLIIVCNLMIIGVFLLFKLKRFIYIPFAFIVGFVLMSGVIDVYSTREISIKNAQVYATISSEIIESENCYYFIVSNLNVNGNKLKGEATVFYKDLPNERAGQSVKIIGDIKTFDFDIHDGYFLSNFRKGNYYSINAESCEYLGEGYLPFTTRYRLSLKKKLFEYTDASTAEVCSALMFGDKFGISNSLHDSVQASGLAHIFAVSGLHIGIIAFFLMWICLKLKLKKHIQFIVIISLLTLYGALCGFPPSVIRAIVMVGVYLFADCIGKHKDNLSSLCFAGIIVLLINPIDIFSVGFLLSFGAVFGIFLLAKPIENKLSFMPKKLNQIISVSIAVNIMLYPIMAYMFGKFQTMFLLSNILILPILPFIYPILLIMCSLVQAISLLSPILIILNYIMFPIKLVSMTVGSMAISVINIKSLEMFSALYYFLIILFSRYVFLTKKIKIKLGCYSTALCIAGIALINIL